jgi:hypothetical protein
MIMWLRDWMCIPATRMRGNTESHPNHKTRSMLGTGRCHAAEIDLIQCYTSKKKKQNSPAQKGQRQGKRCLATRKW